MHACVRHSMAAVSGAWGVRSKTKQCMAMHNILQRRPAPGGSLPPPAACSRQGWVCVAASRGISRRTLPPLRSAGRRAGSGDCPASRRHAESRPQARSSGAGGRGSSWSAQKAPPRTLIRGPARVAHGLRSRAPSAGPHYASTAQLAATAGNAVGKEVQLAKQCPPARSVPAGCPAGRKWTGSPPAAPGRSCLSPPALHSEGRGGRQADGATASPAFSMQPTRCPAMPCEQATCSRRRCRHQSSCCAHLAPGCPPCLLGSQ